MLEFFYYDGTAELSSSLYNAVLTSSMSGPLPIVWSSEVELVGIVVSSLILLFVMCSSVNYGYNIYIIIFWRLHFNSIRE